MALLHRFWAPAALGAILLLAAVVRIYDIVGNPPGFFLDEASFGYNAYSILHTGRDEHGAFLPIFFRAFGEYKLPVYIYSQIPFIAVFGLTELAVRLTSATFGVLTVLAVYLLVQALFRQRALALTAAAILAILPWHIHYSRTGLGDYIVFPFFLTLSLYLFHLGTRRPLLWLAAASTFGLTLYTYRAAWVTLPPLLFVLAVLYHRELIRHWRIALAGAFILVVSSVPIILRLLSVDTDRADQQSILNLDLSTLDTVKRILTNYRSHFTTDFLLEGAVERNLRHVLPGSGWLYWWQVPFIFLGLLALLWKPSRPKLLVLALLAVFPLPSSVTPATNPWSHHAIIGAVAFSIISAYGIVAAVRLLASWQPPQALKLVGVGLAGAVLLGTTIAASSGLASYLVDYHGRYEDISLRGDNAWQWGPGAIMEHFGSVEHEYDELVMDSVFDRIFLRFYAPDGCENCTSGRYEKYDPTKTQLFALRPDELWLFFDHDITGTLHFPNGGLAIVFFELTGRTSELRGALPQVALEESSEPIAELDRAIERNPDEAGLHYRRAVAYSSLGNYEQAVGDYARAIELAPELADAYLGRGYAYWELGLFEWAMRDYGRVIGMNPESALAYYNRANGYAAVGDFARAGQRYFRAIGLDPSLVEAHNNYGNLQILLGNFEAAVGALDPAIELDPSLAVAYANRGDANARLAKIPQALADLDMAVELDPTLALAYAKRGKVYHDLGELDRAIADFGRALELDPSYAEAYGDRGNVRSELGDYVGAIDDFDKAIESDRDYALAYARRGIAYLRLEEFERAKADLDKAVELDRAYLMADPDVDGVRRANPYWHLGGVEQTIAELDEVMAAVTHPSVIAQLEEIIDYLVTR